jgi:hypothetical protein
LATTNNEDTRRIAAESLGKIGTGNPQEIDGLVQLLATTNNEDTRRIAAESLGKIGTGNPRAIDGLFQLLATTNDEDTRRSAAYDLGKIGTGNPRAIDGLVQLLATTNDEDTRMRAAYDLEKIDPGNPKAIDVLFQILATTNDKHTPDNAASWLGEILQKSQMSSVVSALQHCLVDEVHETNFNLFNECFNLIWRCAQNMTYPAFYQAWHQQEEVEKTTTTDSQTLNQADLPQSLQSAIANDPQLSQIIHLICIDGSNFIERDRPAAEIYDQMLDQNCREWDRVLETMPALKLYWNFLKRKSDKRPVLVFYASSTDPYSEAFLKDLSKFGKAICVITEQRFDHIPLKFFAPSQTIEDVVKWIRAKVVEE